MDLNGKNVVYVGGFGGIGFATCKEFVKKGVANLFVLDVVKNDTLLNELKSLSSGNVYFKELDLLKKDEITEVFKHVVATITHFDILINGSGIINDNKPEQTIAINLLGLIYTTMTAIPYMDKANGGRGGIIVNIASVVGLVPSPFLAIYSSSKYGVVGFSQSISHEFYYKRTGIAVITLCPGITTTHLWHEFEGNDTFPYSTPLSKEFYSAKSQTAEECAVNFIKAVETAKNGSIWILDLGKLEEVHLANYWSMTH